MHSFLISIDLELTPDVMISEVRRRNYMMIAEVCEKFHVSQDTLRYYERIGLIPHVNRNKSGVRDYTEEDCKWIVFIKCMRSAGLPIEVLIEYVGLFQQGDETIKVRKGLLIEQRNQLIARIEEMQKTLNYLNHKIKTYDQVVAVEQGLKRQE